MSRQLPPREPLRCRIGLHKWSGWHLRAVWHLGEAGWDEWQHVCLGRRRECFDCGKFGKPMLFRKLDVGGRVVRLPDQPYTPSRAEIDAAERVLLG